MCGDSITTPHTFVFYLKPTGITVLFILPTMLPGNAASYVLTHNSWIMLYKSLCVVIHTYIMFLYQVAVYVLMEFIDTIDNV